MAQGGWLLWMHVGCCERSGASCSWPCCHAGHLAPMLASCLPTNRLCPSCSLLATVEQVNLADLQARLLRTECQLVDFGNATRLDSERLTNEIQTRPYRAPEVRCTCSRDARIACVLADDAAATLDGCCSGLGCLVARGWNCILPSPPNLPARSCVLCCLASSQLPSKVKA